MSFEEISKNYLEKENYVTAHIDFDWWKRHANYQIMKDVSKYIHGIVGDFGCNHGICTLLLLDFKPKEIFGFDINMRALEIAYDLGLKTGTDIPVNFIRANLLKLPAQDNFFDFSMSFHTLEHIYPNDVDKFVSEMYRTLKPGGNLLISIPYDHAYPDPCHVGFYREDSLKGLFEKHNFITVECFKDDRFNEKNLLTAIFLKSNI